MRKFLMAAPLAAMLALGGCATTPTNPADFIKFVQEATVNTCAFLPFATTVANIIAAGNPALQTATEIATAICAAVVPPQGLAKRRGVPTVSGVEIHGRFVR